MPPKRLTRPKKVSEMGPKELEIYNAKIARHREAVIESAINRLEIREFIDPIAIREKEMPRRRDDMQIQRNNQRYEVIEKAKGKGSNFKHMKSSASVDSM